MIGSTVTLPDSPKLTLQDLSNRQKDHLIGGGSIGGIGENVPPKPSTVIFSRVKMCSSMQHIEYCFCYASFSPFAVIHHFLLISLATILKKYNIGV